MRNTPQRRFDAADNNGRLRERFTCALRVHDHRTIRALAALAARRVGIVRADAPVGGVAVYHRIHVAGGDAEKKIRLAERCKRGGAAPIRLTDDTNSKPLRLQYPADQGHAETRVIHIGVAGHQNDVAGIPAQLVHFGARHGQKRRAAESLRPEGPVGKNVARAVHEEIRFAPQMG